MIVEPKVRGFICTTAHPAGCREHVKRQIESVKSRPRIKGAKRVLVIGCSTGYGLATRIAAAFGCGAKTLGVAFENPASGKRTATAGWYNTAAFTEFARAEGLYAKTLIGDAFSRQMKNDVIAAVREDLGQVDLLVYSLAAPRRTDEDGHKYSSVIKPIGAPFTNKTINLATGEVEDVTVSPAGEEEVAATVKVMGGEDWKLWVQALLEAGVLAEGFETLAYSYIGPAVTHPVYLGGTIGMAKNHLTQTAKELALALAPLNGSARISVNKALVTQSSAAIPVVPLYISILYKVMKQKGLHEGCIEQMYRLLSDRLYAENPPLDEEGRFRLDDWELREDIQREVSQVWERINTRNAAELSDLEGYWEDFYHLFGFRFENVDYGADVNVETNVKFL